jgi:adenosylcobinamide kinase/adenosylcobinamide-phosphate guanylyltransferase
VPGILIGTGPASALPPCPCAWCRWTAEHESPRGPARLRLPEGTHLHGGLDAGSPAAVVRVGSDVVLWAPDGPPSPELIAELIAEPAGEPATVAVLGAGTELTGFAHRLARLRSAGALAPAARVALVGLTHDHPRPDRLALTLAAWGVSRPDDGTALDDLPAVPRISGRTLVLGGASSGKSAVAEALLAAEPEVDYLATGPKPEPDDLEWTERVRDHQDRRPPWWRTVETSDAAGELGGTAPVLLDSVGTWLTAVLDDAAAWDRAPGWEQRVAPRMDELVAAWRARTGPLVAVSDEVGLGVVPGSSAGRLFREQLGRLNTRLAAESEQTLLVVAGQVIEAGPGPSH